jgi:hypothetical protein
MICSSEIVPFPWIHPFFNFLEFFEIFKFIDCPITWNCLRSLRFIHFHEKFVKIFYGICLWMIIQLPQTISFFSFIHFQKIQYIFHKPTSNIDKRSGLIGRWFQLNLNLIPFCQKIDKFKINALHQLLFKIILFHK